MSWTPTFSTKPNTLLKHGGGPLNKVYQYLTKINLGLVSPDFEPEITTPTHFYDGALRLRDNDDDADLIFDTSELDLDADVHQYVKFPQITNVESGKKRDRLTMDKTAATLEQKTIVLTDNHVKGTSAVAGDMVMFTDTGSGIIDLRRFPKGTANQGLAMNGTADSLVWINPGSTIGSNVITDSMIAAHTSTKITITDKSHLPSDIVYTSGSLTLSSKTINSLNNVIANLGAFKYMIFKSGSSYYCRDNLSGSVVAFGTDPVPVLRYPLTQGGSCYIFGADYVLSALTGGETVYFDFPVETIYCHYYMAPDAKILVPQGFTGICFRFKNTTIAHCTGNILAGGWIRENGTVTRDWTAVLLEGSGGDVASKGVFANKVVDTRIWDAKNGVRLNCDATSTTGFVISNWIENIQIYRCKADFIGFNMDVTYTTSPVNGSHRNRFNNILLQSSGLTTEEDCVAVNNIMGRENTFIGVYCADFNNKNRTCVIHADSDSTIIDGGSMTVPTSTNHSPTPLPRYVDNSTMQNTKIRDMYRHTQIGKITPGISGTAMEIIPTGSTNTLSWYNSALSERLYIQKGTSVFFDMVRQTSGGSLRDLIFRQYDVAAAGSPVESFRVQTDASIRIAPGKLKLRDSGDDHNITITVPNNAADYNLAIPTLTGNDTILTASGGAIGDAAIAAHTSTKITITNKSQLNSQIAYLDAATWLTNAMVSVSAAIDWSKISKTGSVLADIANVILTSPAEYDILYRNSSGQWVNMPKGSNNRFLGISSAGVLAYNFVTNANILTHTSTQITITAKGQLNSQIGYKDETAWLTDAMMASHTSTKISITTKAQLNSQIGYKDETGWLTDVMLDSSIKGQLRGPTRGFKEGRWDACSGSQGSGIFEGGFTQTGSGSVTFDSANGTYVPFTTGAVSGNTARNSFVNAYTCRAFNPYLGTELMVTTGTAINNRIHFGFKTTPFTPPADGSDDPLANISGVMLVQRSSGSSNNFEICSNNGGAASTFADTGVPVVVNTLYHLEIRAVGDTKFQYNINETGWVDVTATIPASTTAIGYYEGFQTGEAFAHVARIYNVETTSDK